MSDSSTALEIARSAKQAFEASQLLRPSDRIEALHAIVEELSADKDNILNANQRDLELAHQANAVGQLAVPLLKRLDITKGDKWDSMLSGILDVANLPDPTEKISYAMDLAEKLELYRVSCPIGVLLVIFESRPEVVVNIASLAIKSGNVAILKGGKESANTTQLLSSAIQRGLAKSKLPEKCIQTIETRAEVSALLAQDQYIDLVIPRGSNNLVRNIQINTRIPVMGHAEGLCSVYLDRDADEQKAIHVVLDSKTDYPAACNSAESLLVHSALLKSTWPAVARTLLEVGVELRCDNDSFNAVQGILHQSNSRLLIRAEESDYDTEHLSLVISVKTVSDIAEAVRHINSHSSHHTDSIVTENDVHASYFVRGVDSAGCFVNASTRFADGFRYGFGTEVGISTGRIHARGPVGLEGLVSYKYILQSKGRQGHAASDFAGGKSRFLHRARENPALPYQ